MAEVFRLLYCDDRDEQHDTFRHRVLMPLMQERGVEKLGDQGWRIEDFYSANHRKPRLLVLLPEFDVKTKTVDTWIAQIEQGKLPPFDIVVTDMNFDTPGGETSKEGFNIIKRIHQKNWGTVFMLITAYSELVTPPEVLELSKTCKEAFEPESWVDLSKADVITEWSTIQKQLENLLIRIEERRRKQRELERSMKAPELYEVTIIHRDLLQDPIVVQIAEKKTLDNP